MINRLLPAICLGLAFSSQAMAQPSPDRFFGYLDRNQDGRIDRDEMQRVPGPIRDALQNSRLDLSRGLSREDFTREMPRMMEEMRRRREESGGGFGGGSRGSSGGDHRGDGRGPSDYRGRDDRRREDDSRDRNKPPPKPTRWKAKARERVTLDLDDTWKKSDFNGDGQIGLYEWDRSKLSEFLRLDTNHDGLLTPREISFASDATPAPTTSAIPTGQARTSVAAPTSRVATLMNKPASPASGGGAIAKISPVELDKESSEGRAASFVFRFLDKNRDGSLTVTEWNSSQKTRASFEKYGAQLQFPADFEKFAPWQIAVKRAEKNQ